MPLFLIALVSFLILPQAKAAPTDCRALLSGSSSNSSVRSDVLNAFKAEYAKTSSLSDEEAFNRMSAYARSSSLRNETALVNSLRGDVLIAFGNYLSAFKTVEDFEDSLQEVTSLAFNQTTDWLKRNKRQLTNPHWPEIREAWNDVWDDEVSIHALLRQTGQAGKDQRRFEARIRKDPGFVDSIANEFVAQTSSPESLDEALIQKDREAFLGSLLSNLPARTERILRLRDFEDQTLEAIGEKLNISANRVRDVYMRATRMLRWRRHQIHGVRVHRSDFFETKPQYDEVAIMNISRRGRHAFEFKERMEEMHQPVEPMSMASVYSEPSSIPTLGGGPQLTEAERSVIGPERSAEMIYLEEEIAVLNEILKGILMDPSLPENVKTSRAEAMNQVITAKHKAFNDAREYWIARYQAYLKENPPGISSEYEGPLSGGYTIH